MFRFSRKRQFLRAVNHSFLLPCWNSGYNPLSAAILLNISKFLYKIFKIRKKWWSLNQSLSPLSHAHVAMRQTELYVKYRQQDRNDTWDETRFDVSGERTTSEDFAHQANSKQNGDVCFSGSLHRLFPSSEAHVVSYPFDARDITQGIKRAKREAHLNGDYLQLDLNRSLNPVHAQI